MSVRIVELAFVKCMQMDVLILISRVLLPDVMMQQVMPSKTCSSFYFMYHFTSPPRPQFMAIFIGTLRLKDIDVLKIRHSSVNSKHGNCITRVIEIQNDIIALLVLPQMRVY